jgi:NADH-quinone oxidoreductase subunit N
MYFDFFKTTTLLEAFTKFFLTASIASMLLLLGVLFLYKASGSCNLQDLTLLLSDTTGIVSLYDIKQGDVFSLYMNPEEMLMDEFLFLLLIPSVLFFFCGLLFKFAVVPFHSWSPDLYQVLPTPLIIILSTLPKLIYGLVLFKFMFFSLNEYPDIFNWFVTIIAIFAFIYTVLLLLDIDNIKRFIAYSSIPHILTVFLILLSNNIFYLTISFVYFIIYIASLHSLILLLTFNNTIPQYFSSLKKLFSYNSIMLWLFILILLQLAGLPPFSIFILKLNILNFLMSSGSFILYSLMVISSFYSIYYYMRIIKSIFFDINNFFSLEWNISNYKLSLDSFKMVTFSILLFIQLIFIVQPYIFISPVFYFFTFFDV